MNEMQRIMNKVRFQSPEDYDWECTIDELKRVAEEWPDND